MKRYLLLIGLATMLLAACQPDPRKEAQAYATRAEADRSSAAAEQLRQQQEEVHAVEMAERQIDLETKAKTVETLRHGLNVFLSISFWFITAGLCFMVAMTAKSYGETVRGVGNAIVVRAELKANLIPLDVKTRQFPLLRHAHGSRFMLADPNDGSVLMLDAANAADRQKIAAAGAVRLAGAIAYEARKSNDPAGIACINPTIIEAQEGELITGANLIGIAGEASRILAGGRNE